MDEQTSPPGPATQSQRAEYYERIDGLNLAPLWLSLQTLLPRQPSSPVQPAHWDFDGSVRPVLMEAGGLITAKEAERRVLVLENPGLRGRSCCTTTLYAGCQLVMPGEVAVAHRHSPTAIRFILEGQGAYTTVEGERTQMYPGDFVTTPSWTFHDHGNDTLAPTVWLDVLDLPLVQALGALFSESANVDSQAITRPAGYSAARYANNLLPVDWKPLNQNSPVFNYPYARSRESLEFLSRADAPDLCHGYKLRYINPATGGHVLPTIGAFLQLLPKGFTSLPYRCTDAAVYAVVEGEGESRIGEQTIRWKPRDVFVVPSWARHSHSVSSGAVLFSTSDRPVQEKLNLWRELREGEA